MFISASLNGPLVSYTYISGFGVAIFSSPSKLTLGFIVFPYCQADPVLCKRLEEAGAATVMPLGAPIGTNKGLQTKEFLQIIIEQAGIPVVVDAGIGAPSHAAEEWNWELPLY